MRSTVIAPNAWAANEFRFLIAKEGRIACRVLPIEHAAARLAGGFKRPIDRIVVLDLLKGILATECPPALLPALEFPGLVRAVAATLMKIWSANLDLSALEGRAPQLSALSTLEKAVLKKLPVGMLRHGNLKAAALANIALAPKIMGPVTIIGRTEMSPVWRDFIAKLSTVVPVRWDAGARRLPDWLDPAISVKSLPSTDASRRFISCADAAHEVMEALRWARRLLVSGKAKPSEIGICAAAPQAFDGAMSAAVANTVLPVHFIHGRIAAETREGQEAAALADVFLNGLSLQAFRRLASLTQGPEFQALPENWMKILPREAPLANVGRWRDYLGTITDWPGGQSFAERLISIVEALGGPEETASEVGAKILGAKARAIWERALLEGPATALSTSIAGLSITEATDGLTAVAWGSAGAIASSPRPYVWMLGLNAGSWPRGITEDPLLPAHLCDQALLDPLPVIEADRRDFDTILRSAGGEVVISRSRRDVEGRELGISPLWPLGIEAEEVLKSAAPSCPISEGDRLSGRIFEFKASPQGEAANETWRDWHRPAATRHDGLVRPDHPLILSALERPMSASSIRLMLTNPIGWLFREVMGLEAPDAEQEPFEFSPLDFGNLVHGVLERATTLLSAVDQKSGLAGAGEEVLRPAVDAALAEIAKVLEIEVPVPPMRLWRSTLERARIMAGLALQPTFLQPLPGQRSWAEVPFGRDKMPAQAGAPWDTTKPIVIAGVKVTGKVDRLDLSEDGKRGRVIDWKTGRLPKDAGNWVINGGAEVQRPIYAGVALQLTGAKEIEAGLAYLKGGVAFVPVPDSNQALQLLEIRLRAMRDALKAGCTLPGPAAGNDYDDFSFALPGDAKERYLDEKALAVRSALGAAAAVWEDA